MHALFVGGVQMLFAVMALALFPHPAWFSVATWLAFPTGALVGAALSRL